MLDDHNRLYNRLVELCKSVNGLLEATTKKFVCTAAAFLQFRLFGSFQRSCDVNGA